MSEYRRDTNLIELILLTQRQHKYYEDTTRFRNGITSGHAHENPASKVPAITIW